MQAHESIQLMHNKSYEQTVLINLSICAEQLKNLKSAIFYLEQARSLQPNNEQVIIKIKALQQRSVDVEKVEQSHGVNKEKLKIDLM